MGKHDVTSRVVVPSRVMSIPSSCPEIITLGFPSSRQCLMIFSTTSPSICTQSSRVPAVATPYIGSVIPRAPKDAVPLGVITHGVINNYLTNLSGPRNLGNVYSINRVRHHVR
eukprot:750504-Hanusia_phi.AAC.1